MTEISNTQFAGERPLYAQDDLLLRNVTIGIGESSLKHCRHLLAEHCRFEGKYTLWECDDFSINHSYFAESARSSLWYSRSCYMSDCEVDAPKMFRRMSRADIQRTNFHHGQEMFWDSDHIRLKDVNIRECDYIFMHARDILIYNYKQDGNYGFQQARNVEIHNAVINSKDAFWEAENVTIYDSEINGEYLGWYAKNLRLVRCRLSGEQLLCYVDGLTLEDCSFDADANLLFEYSTVKGTILGDVTSIKNPSSDHYSVSGRVGETILDENRYLAHRQAIVTQDCFDEVVPRRGTSCMKYDDCASEDTLPLWVADMDFAVADPIRKALERRIAHPIYGYVQVPDSYYEALTGWFERHHSWTISRESVIYTSGVVPAVSAILKAVTKPGDQVLLLTPVYNCFFSSILNNGCTALELPLVKDGDSYKIDFEAFESLCADSRTTAFLLCNPHNPVGRVWTEEELRKMGDICLRHGVFVIADEIHCELTMPGYTYAPYATLGETYRAGSASCVSCSKAFNTAGLQIANIVATNPEVRATIDRAININEVCDVNPLGIVAMETAYREGDTWLEALRQYLYSNYEFAKTFVEQNIPSARVTRLEGTYLLWLDVSATTMDTEAFCERLEQEAHVRLAAGIHYGAAGEGFLRVNLACTRATLAEALERLKKYIL